MYKLLIFDLDGTLVNSLEDLATAINTSLEKMGLPTHELEKFNYMVGNGIKKLCQRSLKVEDAHRFNELLNLFKEYYSSHYAIHTKPYPYIDELLITLKEKNIKIAIASNKAESFVIQIVNELFPRISFDCIKGQVDTREKKPSPDIVFEIMKELKVSKKETIMIGDTDIDITTGKKANLKTIGCLWGFRDYEELYTAGADEIILNPLEILDIIN